MSFAVPGLTTAEGFGNGVLVTTISFINSMVEVDDDVRNSRTSSPPIGTSSNRR